MASHKTNTVLSPRVVEIRSYCCTAFIITDLKSKINEPVKNFHDLKAAPPVRAATIAEREVLTMAQLGLYGGTVTAGATDGALLSTTNPLKYAGEKGALGDPVAYALRCPNGEHAYEIAISVAGTNPDWVKLSPDNIVWRDAINIPQVGDINTLFYVKINIPGGAEYNQTVLNTLLIKYLETTTTI